MAEKIVVVNAYIGNEREQAFVDWLIRLKFTVALISELGGLTDNLRRAGRVYYNRKDRPHDVGIVVSNRVVARVGREIVATGGRLTRFIRRKGPAKRLWRDRWFVRVQIFRRVYYSIHANAAIAGPEGNWSHNPGAQEWKEGLRKLKVMIREDIDKGRRVRVGGDFNFPASSEAEWSPHDFFTDLGMRYVDDGRVMYLGWTPQTDRMVRWGVLPTAPGADAHGCPWVILKRRSRRSRRRLALAA